MRGEGGRYRTEGGLERRGGGGCRYDKLERKISDPFLIVSARNSSRERKKEKAVKIDSSNAVQPLPVDSVIPPRRLIPILQALLPIHPPLSTAHIPRLRRDATLLISIRLASERSAELVVRGTDFRELELEGFLRD